MREIKFRGYCDRDSEWRYGYYITDGKIHEINTLLPDDKTLYGSQIDIDSLGQYTGLKDKNGVEIYEGDVCKIEKCFTNGVDGLSDHIGIIEYINDRYYVADEFLNSLSPYEYRKRIEVIGNIYEDPELLKA